MDHPLVLAYIGDAVYEYYIRMYLVSLGITKVHELQQKSLEYVSAKSQRMHLERLMNAHFLTEEELDIIRRGRNTKGTKSKSTDIITYRYATGLECLLGYLDVNQRKDRIIEIMDFIVGES